MMSIEKLNTESYFNNLRKKEYARLDQQGNVYLDYTGGNLYPQSLPDMHYSYLQKNIYGNPHSANPASLLSEKMISEARQRVLDFFNAPDYYCVFTANASAALQIVGECYPFSPESHFLLTADNHNSVNGIREYCRNKGGNYTYARMNEEDLSINETALHQQLHAYMNEKNKLFAFPAQSNASGARHSLGWIETAQQQGWDVLLDAAAFVPTSTLNLSAVQPDFVCISFYKIFGYPTGIGCLLIKKSKFNLLKKPWFAGGTVAVSATRYSSHFLKYGHEKFENGTVNYLDIPAITNGLDFITAIGMENISRRIKELSLFMLSEMAMLRHDNGLPLIRLYGPKGIQNRGGNFLLNFFDRYGKQYPFQSIEQRANAEMISLRTGCFCNPGIDETNHCISSDQLKNYFISRNDGDADDMMRFLGKMRGAVRISVGIPTTGADIEKFIWFAKKLLNKTIEENSTTAGQNVFLKIKFPEVI